MTPAFKFVQTPKKWENVEENVVKKTLLKQPQDIPEVSGTDTAKNYQKARDVTDKQRKITEGKEKTTVWQTKQGS